MGIRFDIPVKSSASVDVVLVPGALPTDAPPADHYALFVGNLTPEKATATHMTMVAVEQAMTALKGALTNEGGQALEDRYDIRDPVDPTKRVSNLLAAALEDHVWIGYTGNVADSSKSQLFVGAVEKLLAAYRHWLKDTYVYDYGLPAGVITVGAGTYSVPVVMTFSGAPRWPRGTIIAIQGTTSAGPFGINDALPSDMTPAELGYRLSQFLKGWSQSTFASIVNPADPTIVDVIGVAAFGGTVITIDSLTVTPPP